MTEINTNSNPATGRRAAAVIAGSALTLSTLALGAPAAFADESQKSQEAQETQATDSNGEEQWVEIHTDVQAAHAGDTFNVSGTGFNPNSEIEVRIPGEHSVMARTDENGDVTSEVTIPKDFEDDVFVLTVKNVETGVVAYQEFQVLEDQEPDLVLDDEVAPGEELHMSGSNFTQGGYVTLGWGSDPKVTEDTRIRADNNGNLSTSITIPEDAEAGDYTFNAVDEDSGEDDIEKISVVDDDG